MLKQQARLLAVTVFLIDLALVSIAFGLAFVVRDAWLPQALPEQFSAGLYAFQRYLPFLPLALLVWAVALLSGGRYRSHRTANLRDEVAALFRVTAAATVSWALAIFVLRLDASLLDGDRVSRTFTVLFALFSFVLLTGEKLALRLTSRWVRQRGFNYRTLLIVGTGRAARALADSIDQHAYWGFKLLGFVRTGAAENTETDDADLPAPVLGSIHDMARIVEQNVVDDVIFSVTHRELPNLESQFLLLQEQGIRSRFALNLVPTDYSRIELEEFDGTPLLTFARTPTSYPLLLLKRSVDVAIASVLLLIGLPVVVAIAALIKVTSTGGVLFRQTRCGLNGRQFTLYKFRTMVQDAHSRREELLHLNEMDGPAFKLRRDPRVTWLGRFLRKFSLDELPQLWNVLRGDMSLVGPRPPIPEEVAQYTRWQRRRLSMKPGLTCLWQISGRNNVDFNRWMELDLEYIDHWSPMLDFKILMKTIPVVLTGRGAS
jgi:exopolysaccharide biosynthesis polyprenyl glycosylphosphotransferase